MTKFRLIIVSAIIAIAGLICWRIQQHAGVAARGAAAARAAGAALLAELLEENARLSNQIAHAQDLRPLSGEELRELLRLRSEAGRLHADQAEMNHLRATNEQLLTTLGDRAMETSWTRDQLAYAGYGDPESAMITIFWALNSGDARAILSTLSPEQKAQAEQEGWSDSEIAALYQKRGDLLFPPSATGICLVGKKTASSDEVILDAYYEGEEKTRKFVMKRVGGEWKLQALGLIIAN